MTNPTKHFEISRSGFAAGVSQIWMATSQRSVTQFLLQFAFLFLLISTNDKSTGVDSFKVTHYQNYVNGSHGYIQTPGFPRRFPTPISCQWLIHAPPGKKIVLYFTQYYMRESFKLTEYDYYENPESFRGKHDLGEISFEDEVTSYTVYKSYLMLSFRVHEIGNIHLRVYDFLLDVYGFNITYEVVDRQKPVRKDACSVFKCSFLGNCLATKNFETYKCHCFAGFFGEDCQYGPYCDPDKGINRCRNQGKCRYFYGSLVNTCECPPGYYGVLCEKKQEDFGDTECEKIGCEQKCVKEEARYLCACHEGYRLGEDNKTCIAKGRMRYQIQTRCLLVNSDVPITSNTLLDQCPKFKEELTARIAYTLVPRMQAISNFSITDISLGEEGFFNIGVVFVGEKTDMTVARNSFYDIIRSGKVCNCHMDRDFLNFDAQPALHSLTLENYDGDPVLAGHLLTIVCRVKGSDGLKFKWFKDGAPILVHRTKRNMWLTNIPTSDGESRMSVLNIDHADMLDAGVFTCMATDWGETKSKSVDISVTPKPHVEVTPMVVTVMEGEVARLQCLSGDDERGEFRYVWFRGNERLGLDGNQEAEVVEDLFPVGSRLTVKAGPLTQTYTCEVTAPSGQANSSAQITVAKVAMDTRSCPLEKYFGVTWQQTAANRTDIKLCPQPGGGRAQRSCICIGKRACDWEEPDFSQCTSRELREVADELKKLQLGFMVTDVPVIFEMLQAFLEGQVTEKVFMGDTQLAMEILNGCHTYLRRFYPANTSIPSIGDLIKTASIILERTRYGSLKERETVSIGEEILIFFGGIRRDKRLKDLSTENKRRITTRSIDLQVSHVSASSKWDNLPLYSGRHATVSVPLSLQPNILARSRRSQTSNKGVASAAIVTAVYENLQAILSNDSLISNGFKINSQIVSVGPMVEGSRDDESPEPDSHSVDIRFDHYGLPSQISNITACLHWNNLANSQLLGQWGRGRCTLLEGRRDSTLCRCRTPGHYVVVITSDKAKMKGLVEERVAAITLTGSTIAVIFMVASLLVHIVLWCNFKDDLKVITLNFCIFAICLIAVLMATFAGKFLSQTMCRANMFLAITCYTGTFAFLALELVYIRFSLLQSQLKLTPAKIILIGYGVVICVISAIMICGQVIGFSETSGRYCWIIFHTWELYAFIVPSTIIVLVYSGILVIFLRDVTCVDLSTPKKEKRKYLFFVCRSTIVQTLLSTVCVLSITIANNTSVVYQSIFAVSIAVLGVFYFLAYALVMVKLYGSHLVPCFNRLHLLIFKTPKNQIPTLESNGSIKAFLKPTGGSKGESIEGSTYTGRESPYKKDTNIYTKDQMRSLLSNSTDSASSSKESDTKEILRALSQASDTTQSGSSPSKAYRSISDYNGGDTMDDTSAESQRSGTRENHNALCDCGKCGSDLPFKPTRGQSFIITDDHQLDRDSGVGGSTSSNWGRKGRKNGANSTNNDDDEDDHKKVIPTSDMLELVPSYVRIEPMCTSNRGKSKVTEKEENCRSPPLGLRGDRPC